MRTFSAATARRIALGAQGFGRARPDGRVDRRHLRRLFDTVGVVQIDSVNVIVRSQELPLWARLGPHRRDLLTNMVDDHELFEYWGHEASFVPVERHPLLRWRMENAALDEMWPVLTILAHERPQYIEDIYAQVRDRGPRSANDLSDGSAKTQPWWGWTDAKIALEYLFLCGRLTARRRGNFERVYDLTERVIPAAVLALPTPSEDDAKRALLTLAARSLGIATARDLANYYRTGITRSRPLVRDLVESGELVPVAVDGWRDAAFLHRDAAIPRRIDAASVLSPFDSLIWAPRDRTERLFDFRYRIELYTPQTKRVHGYYVLPFLLGDRLVGRVDLKADRKAGALLAPGVFCEEDVEPESVAGPLARELSALAAWLGLERVVVGERGGLAGPLRRVLAPRGTALSAYRRRTQYHGTGASA
ncbi:MAG TPA: crosslink repair DNA glycosylase YcaQ family protein [Acidimicrobiia bacterium]|nr:crosslink repair DNA glycosylase YcaQ family protein [Acidimicrobiia bacterium]